MVFFVALCIQFTSSYLMYDYSKDIGECKHDEFSLTLIRASESLTMLIYMFLVWRMIFVYSKLFSDRQEKTCAQKSADWVSKHQNKFIVAYFLIANTCDWTTWYLRVYTNPIHSLTHDEITVEIIVSIINFVIEFGLGILFILLWRFFNTLLKSPQFGISRRKRCWNNVAATIIITLYFVASLGFELLVLVITVETLNNAEY